MPTERSGGGVHLLPRPVQHRGQTPDTGLRGQPAQSGDISPGHAASGLVTVTIVTI